MRLGMVLSFTADRHAPDPKSQGISLCSRRINVCRTWHKAFVPVATDLIVVLPTDEEDLVRFVHKNESSHQIFILTHHADLREPVYAAQRSTLVTHGDI